MWSEDRDDLYLVDGTVYVSKLQAPALIGAGPTATVLEQSTQTESTMFRVESDIAKTCLSC